MTYTMRFHNAGPQKATHRGSHRMVIAMVCSGLCFLSLLTSQEAPGRVRLPRPVSDGMVLQRDTGVRIWGWASPGEQVSIRFLGKTRTATTTPDSEWMINLPPMKAGGPYSMEIDGTNHIVLNNILIGEVWVCSGQ